MLLLVEKPQCYEKCKDAGSRIILFLFFFEIFELKSFQFISWHLLKNGQFIGWGELGQFDPLRQQIQNSSGRISSLSQFLHLLLSSSHEETSKTSTHLVLHSRQIIRRNFTFQLFMVTRKCLPLLKNVWTIKKKNSPFSHLKVKTGSIILRTRIFN